MAPDELDHRTLEALYLRLEGPIYGVVYRWLWDPEDAVEVVQQAFVQLWEMRVRVDLARVEPLVWRIALNLAANRRRRKKLLQWVLLDFEPPQDPAFADAPAVRKAVEALPERLRSVVMLTEVAGLSYAEVGEVLGIPAGTVGSRRNKALARMEEALR